MQTDHWGYRLDSRSADAAVSMNRAFAAYYGFGTDTMQQLEAASNADPAFALPHAVRGLLLESLKKPELHPAATDALNLARAARPPQTARERHYLAALECALAGEVTAAVTHYQQIVRDCPHDLFAMRLAQSELFWIGEVAWMRDISERAAPGWNAQVAGYPAFLAIRAFGLEETGEFELAEKYGRQSVELDESDCWGAHAVAHVQIMQGRSDDGVAWLSSLCGNWEAANHIRHHLWWHLALFHTEKGDFDAALAIYDERLRDLESPLMRAMPDFYVDIQNDTALLQRLELRGVDVGERWQPVADLAAARSGNHRSPFTSAHCALALAAAGRFDEAEQLLQAIEEFARAPNGPLGGKYALAVWPAAAASIAYHRGDYQGALERLLPARRNLWQMGGSHAQRDLFFQLLVDAAVRTGRGDLVALLLDEIGALGLEHLAERSSYTDACAAAY